MNIWFICLRFSQIVDINMQGLSLIVKSCLLNFNFVRLSA